MKTKITFEIEMDENGIPETISWNSSDEPGELPSKAISISVWNTQEMNTMSLNLWTKEMPVDEMYNFYLNTLAGMASSLKDATGETDLPEAIIAVCDQFGSAE